MVLCLKQLKEMPLVWYLTDRNHSSSDDPWIPSGQERLSEPGTPLCYLLCFKKGRDVLSLLGLQGQQHSADGA